MDVIDVHTHLRTKEGAEQWGKLGQEVQDVYTKWFKGRNFITQPYTVDEILRLMDASGVTKIVVFAVDYETSFKCNGFKIPNEVVARLMKEHPDRFHGVAGVDPNKKRIAYEELKYAIEVLGLKGLKLVPQRVDVFPNDKERCYPLYELCQKYRVPVWVHIGFPPYPYQYSRYVHPETLSDVGVDFPDLTVIGAHIGFPYTEVMIANCIRFPNMYTDTAAWSPKRLPQIFVEYMNTSLQDKILYGSDWCLLPWDKTIVEMRNICRSEKIARKVLHDNARRVLRL